MLRPSGLPRLARRAGVGVSVFADISGLAAVEGRGNGKLSCRVTRRLDRVSLPGVAYHLLDIVPRGCDQDALPCGMIRVRYCDRRYGVEAFVGPVYLVGRLAFFDRFDAQAIPYLLGPPATIMPGLRPFSLSCRGPTLACSATTSKEWPE